MRVAILVSSPVDFRMRDEIERGLTPQRDYFALADALDAVLIAPARRSAGGQNPLAKLLSSLKIAWAAYRRRRDYDLIISDVDRTGVALALIFKLLRCRRRHVMISHTRLPFHIEGRLVRQLRLSSHIDRFVCYSPVVAKKMVEVLGVPGERVISVRHASDHRFWQPQPVEPEKLICSAGLYHRDYPTLYEAVKGLDIALVAAPYSPWMAPENPQGNGQPPNVTLVKCDYRELRDLYARSLFVAIPLVDTIWHTGSLVLYEAMAMGKAVISTRSEGQVGLNVLREGVTGIFVSPGDVEGWRRAISYFCQNPNEALRMGQNGRAVVEQGLNLDNYIREMVAVVRSVAAEAGAAEKGPAKARV